MTLEVTGGLCRPCFKKHELAREQAQIADERKDRDLIVVGRQYARREGPTHYKERAIEWFRRDYTLMLTFLDEQGLLRKPFVPAEVSDWSNFEVRYSMFTDEGAELFRRCHYKWLQGLDRGTKPTYMGLWKKELGALRASRSG